MKWKEAPGRSLAAVAGITTLAFLLAVFAAGVVALSPRTASAAPPEPCSTAEPLIQAGVADYQPQVSVSPNKGPGGSTAQLHIWNFLPDQAVNAIFRSAGDPVVAQGTVGANGEAYLNFTVPQAPDGVYWILVAQENRTCVHAAVHFTIGQVPPPTPTVAPPTPTTPPLASATPIAPKPTVTVVPPVTGSGDTGGTDSGANSGLLLIALAIASTGFGLLGLGYSRRSR
ncbi:MAG: hypothetical protein LC118_11530 [Dehalococcoidia bacterium]|nr:hypothetical protein [Dehalococcoidia bacterium]